MNRRDKNLDTARCLTAHLEVGGALLADWTSRDGNQLLVAAKSRMVIENKSIQSSIS